MICKSIESRNRNDKVAKFHMQMVVKTNKFVGLSLFDKRIRSFRYKKRRVPQEEGCRRKGVRTSATMDDGVPVDVHGTRHRNPIPADDWKRWPTTNVPSAWGPILLRHLPRSRLPITTIALADGNLEGAAPSPWGYRS